MHEKDDGTRTRDEVAVLAPSGRDGRLTEQVLGRWGLHAVACPDMAALCDRVRAGVGVLVIAEEALRSDARSLLLAELGAQPSWSDVPVVILTAEGELSRPLAEGVEAVTRQVNATLLERPIRTATLTTTVRAALRARARQYDVRDHLRERERLVEAERLARTRAVRLQELTAALSVAASVDEVIEAIVEHAANALGATSTVIAWLADGMVELLRSGEMPDASREAWQRFPLAAEAPLSDVTRTGEPVFLESRDDWRARYPALVPLTEQAGHHANAIVPLVVEGRPVGALGFAFSAPTTFDADDRSLALAVGRQCALALARARLFEAERQARTDAESANRSKSQFLATMSHELRTPLNAIGGYAELIELGIHGPVTEPQVRALERIQMSQRHLLGLINSVLNYTRVETGRVHYDIADVPVLDAMATCEALIAPQMRARGLRYEFAGCERTVTMRADTEKVQQIVLNLLSNAVKFTERGGSVTVSCDVGDSCVHVRVSDTGRGIPGDRLESIFEPFVQVDARLTRTQDGVGLGLAISRDLARGMGGDLVGESTVGAGSTFTLTLPRGQ